MPTEASVIERLADLAAATAAAPDLLAVHRALRDFALATTPTRGIFVSRYDAERRERTAVYAWSEGEEIDVSTLPVMGPSDSPHSRAVTSGEVVVSHDLDAVLARVPHVDVGMERDPRPALSSLAVPIVVAGRVVGGFEVQSLEPAAYGTEHVAAMRLAGSLAGMATENERLLAAERRQRRLAERSEARLNELIHGLDALVFEVDVEASEVTFVGGQVEPLLGRTASDLLGPLPRWLSLVVHADDRDRAAAAVAGTMETGRDLDIEIRAATGDSRPTWLHAVGRLVHDPSGRARLVGVAVDAAERRRLEEQLFRSQKMEAVGQLAGGVAHDFNNLLTAIRGSAQLLLSDLGPDDPRRADAETIEDAADRGAALVRQLLAFGRRQRLQPAVVDLNELVAGMTPLVRRLIGEHIVVRQVAADDLGRMRADPTQLQQVVLNLVVNARDAMPDGGELILETVNVDLDEGYARVQPEVHPGPYVMLAVGDTGVGMDRETLEHLFEPFFTTKRAGEGSGLGLATVYGIVRQSGGHVSVFSEPGHGTTFRIYFPRVFDAVAVRRRPRRRSPATGSERILVVEDDEAVRALTSRALERLGYDVQVAPDPAAAIRLVDDESNEYELLLTDLVMPGMSGAELAEQVLARREDMRVLFMSGYAGQTLERHGPAAGAPLLGKPFTTEALAAAVRRALAPAPE